MKIKAKKDMTFPLKKDGIKEGYLEAHNGMFLFTSGNFKQVVSKKKREAILECATKVKETPKQEAPKVKEAPKQETLSLGK